MDKEWYIVIIKGLDFIQTCGACPEQYDVKDSEGNQIGYVRLRFGGLYCQYPNVGGETIYSADIGDGWTGCFKNDKQRKFHLNRIADKLLEQLECLD